MIARTIIFSTLIIFLTSGLLANHGPDSTDYQEIIKELDYKRTKTVWVPKPRDIETPPPIEMPELGLNIDGLIKTLGYLAIAIILIIILYYSIKWYKPQVAKIQSIDLENIENIEEVDLISLLDQALLNKDYRLAFRIKYLSLLQLLSIKKVIKWKPYKTNRNYVVESSKQVYADDFSQTTRVFEYTWYGLSAINEHQYTAYSSEIDSLNQLIADAE